MTKFYGLTPMDLDEMTYREISEYVVQMQQAQVEEERQARRR